MARPIVVKDSIVVSTRFAAQEYSRIQEIAALESINTGRKVTAQELIREAISYVYGDNERLRECFRRSREHISRRLR